ncbi:MAG: divalent-cation tolerance protein CutA [Candidatus Omnitrophota bacterium]
MEKLCIVYVTTSGQEEAEKIGKELVSRRLAACVNIFDKMTSFYRWEGKEQKDEEAVLLIKTRESLFPELEKAIRGMHSYSCPCIEAIPVLHVNEDYANWVANETQ